MSKKKKIFTPRGFMQQKKKAIKNTSKILCFKCRIAQLHDIMIKIISYFLSYELKLCFFKTIISFLPLS